MQRCQPSRPILVGLVGRIGAGKSTVARLLAARGASVIDADRIAHEVLADAAVAREVAERLGREALRSDGSVDRRSVARLVFGDTEAHRRRLQSLETIVHPRVRERISAQIDACSVVAPVDGDARVIVLDVPLLMHGGWDRGCDWLVRVVCDESVRRRRLASRGWTESEIESRDEAWEARHAGSVAEAKVREATVDASRDESYTDVAVDSLWRSILATGGSTPPPP